MNRLVDGVQHNVQKKSGRTVRFQTKWCLCVSCYESHDVLSTFFLLHHIQISYVNCLFTKVNGMINFNVQAKFELH